MAKNKKGKKAAGRAGAKQKAKGRNSTTPRSTSGARGYAADNWDDDEPVRFKGFSGAAPFTPQSSTATPLAFGKLRHQAISFVSAGTSTPPPQLRPQKSPQQDDLHLEESLALDDSTDEDSDDDDIDDSNLQTNIVIDEEEIEVSEKSMARMHIHTSADAMDVDAPAWSGDTDMDTGAPSFVVDTVGDPSLADVGIKPPGKRAPSPAPSDSSEEVILFHGRSKATVVNDPIQKAPAPAPKAAPQQPRPPPGWGNRPSAFTESERPGDTWSPAPAVPYWKKGKGRAVPRPDLAPSAEELKKYENSPPKQTKVQFAQAGDEEDGGDAEQTIGALQADLKKVLREKKKVKEADLVSVSQSSASGSTRRKKRGRKKDNRALRNAIVSSDDNDSEAAYDDYMENLKAQLDGEEKDDELDLGSAFLQSASRPSAISGPSMVVDGEAIGDDELLPGHMRHKKEEEGTTQLHDEDDWESDDSSVLNPDFDELSPNELDDMNASDLESDLEYTEKQQWEDEDDLRQRRIDALSDEQIARLLAKQQEFGIDGDELLIEDGDFPYIPEDGVGDVARARAGLSEISNFSLGRRPNKHGMRRARGGKMNDRDFFPDASLMADTVEQYGENGFDIMDFDRPSLRPLKKGRKGKLPPELDALSDEDMKANMLDTWEKDRARKREKKLEREALRADGLLGSAGRKGKADLSQRYPLGMTLHQVWSELAEFLQDDDSRERSFPPMDKTDRKALHEVAIALNLNSKSQGSGLKRFPIIYKTSLTDDYSPDMFKTVIQASTRGFLTNSKAKKMAKRAKKGPGKGFGGGTDAATVRHGEIVGTGAAEIGKDSFGHKLMEKMGWSKGKGLGKDGEGLLVPVEQVMRRGTAGLG